MLNSQLQYQGITIEYQNKTYSYFLEVYTLKQSAVYPNTIRKLNNFSGTLNVYSFEGKNLGSIGLTKGMARNISDKEDLNILTKAINLFSKKSNLTNRIPPCNTAYIIPMQFSVNWYTETWVNDRLISYALTDVTTETIFVEMTNSCDAPTDIIAHGYRDEIINSHSQGGTSIINSKEEYDAIASRTDGTGYLMSSFQSDNTVTSGLRINIVPWAGVKLYFVQKKVGGKYEIQNVTSQTVGLSAGFSWEQSTYSQSTNGTTTTVIVSGTWSYILYLQGLGTIYSDPFSYAINIKNTTGEIISGRRL